MKTVQTGILFLLLVLISAGNAFAQESQCPRVPLLEALDAMNSDSEVTVTQVPVAWPGNQDYNPQYYYEFEPVGIAPQNGFIIYPGGNVDVRAYAVLARAIAKSGFLVALVPMPTCLVLFGVERADAVIDNNPEITTWAIGGHSFAATGACWYVYNKAGNFTNSSKIKGVVLWAGIPDPSQPLTDKPVKALTLWATNNPRTNEEVINDSKPNLPPDTHYIALQGANHAQFGWYGDNETDYDYFADDGSDLPADISRQMQTDLMFSYTVNFLDSLTPDTLNIPAAEDEVTADDGSIWEKVSLPGFADRNNTDIVALTPYKGNLYALTRNDITGFELWKTDPGQGWYRIHVQGLTDQNNYFGYLQQPDLPDHPFDYLTPQQYNPNMNIWADMIEFNSHLYVALSTGYMGSALFGSRGAAIWRTESVEWEPVIGGHEPTAQGTLSAISSCGDDDETNTAIFTDDNQTWDNNTLVNCIIDVDAEFTAATHGQTDVIVPGKRLFRITANTANQLTVQQQEKAATIQSTRCDEYLNGGGDIGRPRNNIPGVATGAAYSITCGDHARGFGDMWDKSIIDFEVFNNELYASIGLNTDKGARVMKTSDGLTWFADSPYSFDNIHGTDWHDNSTFPCEKREGEAVSSSATKMVKTSITGEETLLIGGTGTSGCNGVGARVYRRDGSNLWTPIVDVLVDENNTGSNENGFGYDSGGDFFRAAFQTWSWLEYLDTLFVGLQKIEGGTMIYSTDSAAEEDGAWTLSMGGTDNPNPDDTSPNPALNGFGDVLNTGVFLHNYNDIIYAGTMVTNQSIYYTNSINGADLWQGTDVDGSISWNRIVSDGFGDSTVLQFQSFTEYDEMLYMAAASVNSSNLRGNEPENYTGVVVYRLAAEVPECQIDSDCSEGHECVDGSCETIPGDPPTIDAGPFLAAGYWPVRYWPVLPTDPDNPIILKKNWSVVWTFSDDYKFCSEACTHMAEYQAIGDSTWTALDVSTDNSHRWYAYVDLPIKDENQMQNATTYALRFTVTDCANQSTESDTYYFRVAVTDAPPVIESGPFLAAGSWPMLPTAKSNAIVLNQNWDVLWTFSDDYASCPGQCTHRARYRKVGVKMWTWLTPSTDLTGEWYAYVTLPIDSDSLAAGTYVFQFDVADCASQYTLPPHYYYFKVE